MAMRTKGALLSMPKLDLEKLSVSVTSAAVPPHFSTLDSTSKPFFAQSALMSIGMAFAI